MVGQEYIVLPSPNDNEPAWSKWIAQERGGIAEFRCREGSRVDVLTDSMAYEVEWVKKWKEAIGQALLYSVLTGRPGGVILLLRGKPNEEKYILRCAVACARAGLLLEFQETM